MQSEVWVGKVEVRQLPGLDHKIELSGKGAFTWVTCWATDAVGYRARVAEVMTDYGLFVVETDQIMPFANAEDLGIVDDELIERSLTQSRIKNSAFMERSTAIEPTTEGNSQCGHRFL